MTLNTWNGLPDPKMPAQAGAEQERAEFMQMHADFEREKYREETKEWSRSDWSYNGRRFFEALNNAENKLAEAMDAALNGLKD